MFVWQGQLIISPLDYGRFLSSLLRDEALVPQRAASAAAWRDHTESEVMFLRGGAGTSKMFLPEEPLWHYRCILQSTLVAGILPCT